MEKPRKKPGWAFWLAAAVLVAVLYAASFGPACWAVSRQPGAAPIAARAFFPIVWLSARGPRPIRATIIWYGDAMSDRFWTVVYLQGEIGILSRMD